MGSVGLWLRFNADPIPREMAKWANMSDLLNYYYPMAQHLARRLGAGELPLWNPDACSGMPLLATMQVSAFYPGSWLAVVMPAHEALACVILVECALAGCIAAWLMRSWGCDAYASAFGGLLFVSTCMVHNSAWPTAVSTILWIPWILLCVEKLAVRATLRWWAALAIGTALQIFAGFPQYLIYGFQAAGIIALLRIWQERDRSHALASLATRGAVILSAVLLGVGLASVQLLPTLELIALGPRQDALSSYQIHYLTRFNPHRSSELLLDALSPVPQRFGFGIGYGAYLGVTSLPLLALGLFAARRRALAVVLLAGGAIALLLSDGYRGPGASLFQVYSQLPVVGSLRTPERMRVLTFLAAAAIAALGFDALGRSSASKRRRAEIALLATSVAVVGGMVALGHVREVWRPLGVAVLGWGVLRGMPAAVPRPTLQMALLLLVFVDLTLATGHFGVARGLPIKVAQTYQAPDGDFVPPRELRGELERTAPQRVELRGYKPYVAAEPSHGVQRIGCYEPLAPKQWFDLHRAIHSWGSRGATLVKVDPEKSAALLDVASVALIISPPDADHGRFQRNPDALPRAYWIDRFDIVSRDAAIEQVARGDVDFRRVVLLDRDPGVPSSQGRLLAAKVSEYLPERVAIQVRAPEAGLLVLTDTHYPGWHVEVDGEEREILLANGLYRAVAIGKGTHRVVFEYRPASFRRGAGLSLASLATLVAVIAVGRIRGPARDRVTSP